MTQDATTRGHGDVVVGITGTFDVENYGDLLFPLIAAEALKRRDRRIRVEPFSPNGKVGPSWPFPVRPVSELTASISTLAAMLIGGGQIVRFDDSYPVAAPANVDLPFAYWLTPALLAALVGKPVIWNAVGATVAWPRDPWHYELTREVLAASYFIGVRDVLSREALARVAPDANVELLPDTAFGLSRLWPLEKESLAFTTWRESMGFGGPYIVVQANAAVGRWHSTIDSLMESMTEHVAVLLPVCWCHGDRADAFPRLKGKAFVSRVWPAPGLIREIIGRAEFVVASSLHACITALSYGVPGARVPIARPPSKFDLLGDFAGIVSIEKWEALRALQRRGRCIEPRAIEDADRLERYWDQVSEAALHPPLEHGDRSRARLLRWLTKECGDQGHVGFARQFIAPLRKSLVERFPVRRTTLRRWLSWSRRMTAAAFRRIAQVGTPPIGGPREG